MKIDVLTLFPALLDGFLSESILGKAISAGHLRIGVHNLRDWAMDRHRTTDDRPFGGGAGMVMKPEPLFAAIDALAPAGSGVKRILLSPDGVRFDAFLAVQLAKESHLLLVSGHYEGVDQRVRDHRIDLELSIGDYVLTNGTLAAAVVIDAVARHIPGVLGEEKSLTAESFTDRLLDFPQYTRPAEYQGMKVPEVLLSGNHSAIEKWRYEQRVLKTRTLRPDLFEKP